jgi:hypothetical protein
VSVSADGRRAVISCLGELLVWDLERGQKVCGFSGDGERKAVDVSDDGHWAVTVDRDEFKVYDLNKCRRQWDLKHDGGQVEAVALAPNGRYAVSGSNTLQVWNVERGQMLAGLRADSPVRALSITSDGQTVVSASRDGTFLVWQTSAKQPRLIVAPELARTMGGECRTVSIRAESMRAIVAHRVSGNNWMLTIYDLHAGSVVYQFPFEPFSEFGPHKAGRDLCVAISSDGRRAAAASIHELRIWNVGRRHRSHPGDVYGLPGRGLNSVALAKHGCAVVIDMDPDHAAIKVHLYSTSV